MSISFNISLTFESNQCFIYLNQYNYNNKEGKKPKMGYKQKQVNLKFFISNLQHEHKNASLQGPSEHGPLFVHSYVLRTAKQSGVFLSWFTVGGSMSMVAQVVKKLSAKHETQRDPWVRKIPWRRIPK